MATLDQIYICNPTDTDFEVHYDRERYTLDAGEETTRTKFLARHMAKHLSDRMMIKDFYALQKDFMKKNKNLSPYQVDQKLGTKKTMLTMQDCPERRIALYKILRSTDEVNKTIDAYPQFKTRKRKDGTIDYNTVGDITIYNEFVEKAERVIEPEEPKEEPKAEVKAAPKKAPKPKKATQA